MTPITLTPQALESLTNLLAKEVTGPETGVKEFLLDQYKLLNHHTGSTASVDNIIGMATAMYNEAASLDSCHCDLHSDGLEDPVHEVDTYEFFSTKSRADEVDKLSSDISKSLKKDRLAQLIAQQVNQVDAYDEEAAYDFDEDAHDEGLAYEFEELLESLLDGLADSLIEEGLLDEMFTIGENSTELYSLYFQTRFFEMLDEINFPDEVEYKEEYTAYLMGALSHRLITEKGYMLYYHIENDVVFPVLKPQAQ